MSSAPKRLLVLTALAPVLLAAAPAAAVEVAWVGARAGTLGVGGELGVRILPTLVVRGIVQGGDSGYDQSIDGIDYAGSADLGSFGAQLDWRPPFSPLFISAGIFANSNEISLDATPTGTVQIGSGSYAAAQVGTLTGAASFDERALYGGLGLEFSIGPLAAVLEGGVYLQGDPAITMRATGPLGSNPAFINDLNQEIRAIEDELDSARYWPAITLQGRWKF